MAEHHEEHKRESLKEKISDKIHAHHSSSSDSDDDKHSASSIKSKVYRLFGREQPVHKLLAADVLLWRDKKISAAVLGTVTAIWALFEVLEYTLLSLICHLLILTIVVLFLLSNASTLIKKSPPEIPEVHIPEGPVLEIASTLIYEINDGLASLREIASGRDLKKFLAVVSGLWIFSILGSCCNFVTLFYICFVLLHTFPVLYEKYEDQVDAFGEKAMVEIKKRYAVFEEKVLSKISSGSKDKKLA